MQHVLLEENFEVNLTLLTLIGKFSKMSSKTPAMILQELSIKKVGRGPDYQLITCNQGSSENEFEYVVFVLGITSAGRGRSKKEAKQETARNALIQLKERFNIDGIPNNISTSQTSQLSPDDTDLPHVINYIGSLDDRCAQNNLPCPVYELILDDGPPHQKVFSYKCILGKSLVTTSTASTKKVARQTAAKMMLERIQDVVPDLAKEYETDRLKLTETDVLAAETYMEMNSLKKPNLYIRICDYHLTMRRYMTEKDISFDDIEKYFDKPHTDEMLTALLKTFELEYDIDDITEEGSESWVIAINVQGSVPLCVIAQAATKEIAMESAREKIFRHIQTRVTAVDYDAQTPEELLA